MNDPYGSTERPCWWQTPWGSVGLLALFLGMLGGIVAGIVWVAGRLPGE